MTGKSVVVVEDEPVVAELIRFVLEKEGYRITGFNNKTGVMNYLQQNPASLVLLDLALGNQDGLDICEQIKSLVNLQHIPVILLSAHRDLENIADQCAANGYVTKPIELHSFAKTIGAFIP